MNSLARLTAKDPRTAARIERNDIRRLSRSLEIVMESGGALTKAKVRERPLLPEYDFRSFFLCRPRDALALRIRARTRHMFLSNFCGTEGFVSLATVGRALCVLLWVWERWVSWVPLLGCILWWGVLLPSTVIARCRLPCF